MAVVCAATLVGVFLVVRQNVGVETAAPDVVALGGFVPVDPPQPLPELALTDLDGRAVTGDVLAGRHVLLNLWATWCAPCVREMPALQRLQAALGGQGFRVVALSLDRGGAAQVKPFLDRIGVGGLDILLDPAGRSMQALAVRGLPTTFLLDPQGRQIARFEGGAEWDHADMVAELKRRMGQPG